MPTATDTQGSAPTPLVGSTKVKDGIESATAPLVVATSPTPSMVTASVEVPQVAEVENVAKNVGLENEGDAICLTGVVPVRFYVILFSEPDSKCFVCGNIEQLGSWDVERCPEMTRVSPPVFKPGYERIPAIYTLLVDVPGEHLTDGRVVQFKFIREEQGNRFWEDNIQTDSGNRTISFNPSKPVEAVNDHLHFGLELGPRNLIDGVLTMSPSQFQVSSQVTEYVQTTTYYRSVKSKNDMDYHIIDEHVVLGSSPRTREHLMELKEIGVHTILNLQTEEDVIENGPCHADEVNDASAYRKTIEQAGINLIWQPTVDMCTEGRSGMVANAAWLMGGVLEQNRGTEKNLIYVHCNAGVGRSTAATMAYLCYLRGMTPEEAHLAVSSIRPVVFFDKEAIIRGQSQFEKMFGKAKDSLKFLKR